MQQVQTNPFERLQFRFALKALGSQEINSVPQLFLALSSLRVQSSHLQSHVLHGLQKKRQYTVCPQWIDDGRMGCDFLARGKRTDCICAFSILFSAISAATACQRADRCCERLRRILSSAPFIISQNFLFACVVIDKGPTIKQIIKTTFTLSRPTSWTLDQLRRQKSSLARE